MDNTRINIAVQIIQGLLASGHYTKEETQYKPAEITRVCNGGCDDWKESGMCRRYSAQCIEDALILADELLEQVKLDETKQ